MTLIYRSLVFDSDIVGSGVSSGQFMAPFHLGQTHAAQAFLAAPREIEGAKFF